jgi:hypothetical protein
MDFPGYSAESFHISFALHLFLWFRNTLLLLQGDTWRADPRTLQTRWSVFLNFIFRWPCISLQILTNNQLDALFYLFIYFVSLRVSSITVLIIGRSNSINTSSGMISSLLTGIPNSHSHRLIIPDEVLIQFDLLMMSAVTLETRRDTK